MQFSEALRRTMFEYGLTGAELSRISGISQKQISEFKNGEREMRTDSLKKLTDAMPEDARRYYFQLVSEVNGNNLATAGK